MVSSSALPSGAATESSLSSIDGKVTACDTSALSTELTASSMDSTLSTLDGKVTACDTSALATEVSLSSVDSTLSTLDGKVTACDTSALATEVSLSSVDSTLSTLDGKISQGYSTITSGGSGAQQMLAYGKDNLGDLQPIHITSNGDVEVEIADFVKGQSLMADSFPVVLSSDHGTLNVYQSVSNQGSQGNLVNNSTLNMSATSTVVDISQMNHATILYEDDVTVSSDEIGIEVSLDNSTFYELGTIYPSVNAAGTKRIGNYTGLSLHGMLYIRLKNKSSLYDNSSCIASVAGSA